MARYEKLLNLLRPDDPIYLSDVLVPHPFSAEIMRGEQLVIGQVPVFYSMKVLDREQNSLPR